MYDPSEVISGHVRLVGQRSGQVKLVILRQGHVKLVGRRSGHVRLVGRRSGQVVRSELVRPEVAGQPSGIQGRRAGSVPVAPRRVAGGAGSVGAGRSAVTAGETGRRDSSKAVVGAANGSRVPAAGKWVSRCLWRL